MMIHYIWLGGDIPFKYHHNIKVCQQLNSGYQFIFWKENDVTNLLLEYNLLGLYNTLSFINKYNLFKYVVLDKFGGVYTDLDIKWKKPFTQIQIDNKFPQLDIVLTHSAYPFFQIDNKQTILLDDPFIISKPNLFHKCLEYRFNRTLRIDPSTNKVHKAEPIGPFLLTEWIHYNNIKVSVFNQEYFLDGNGYYGNHDQLGLWN